ncbi:MAG: 3-deoxy-D-manno-octulosonic acid transferase [Phycisphaerae bacterium]|nr:3-deoxy-D-manno-octulosonic acid transferase [Phycisphaerae bacterium]
MTWLANFVYALAALVYLPVLVYQMVAQNKNRRGWKQRLGHIRPFAPDRPRIWVHAVSLGEVNATPKLVAALRHRLPDVDVVISTTTDTGYVRACALYGQDRVFRYPLDFSWIIRRVLNRVRPSLIVLVELEVWYNLVALASRRGVPVAVVNGRLTERSRRRLGRLGPLGRSMFRRLAWVGAQDETIAKRFQAVGTPADRLEITGSVKWDTAHVSDRIEGSEKLAEALGLDQTRPLWVCGSTGPGEERIILDAYDRLCRQRPEVGLVIVPRKPERFEEVAELIRSSGYDCVRRSEHPDGSAAPASGERPRVWLGDTLGELRRFYALAAVVFVGRSLVPMGGSDPMEVAALAKPIVVGPHMENFSLPVACLERAGGIRIVRSADGNASSLLCREVESLVNDAATARRVSAAARQVVLDNQGATERTATALVKLFRRCLS